MTRKLTAIADLVPDAANRRRHPERNLEMLVASLAAVGTARSIVIDETNAILAGNGVTTAATRAGLTKLRIIDGRRRRAQGFSRPAALGVHRGSKQCVGIFRVTTRKGDRCRE